MIFAQISDLHVTVPGHACMGRVDTAGLLGTCVARLAELDPAPQFVVASGDLVDIATVEAYAQFRALLSPLSMPVYVIPGNHDDRDQLRAAFSDHPWLPRSGFLQYVIDADPLRLVFLDTLVPGQDGGELCDVRLSWLAEHLAEAPERPTVLVMHHPPFLTGVANLDDMGLAGAEALARLLGRFPQVERILCGHLHRSIQVRWQGVLASVCPSTAHQVALDLRPHEALCYTLEPPGFQLHTWTAATGLVSHTLVTGRYPGPYSF
ncbi:MAG: phosphodiesterase [Betaproteobacteria bacterium]|nr:phosphodiesterase [Betaproteobacteria bacterium]